LQSVQSVHFSKISVKILAVDHSI